MTPGRRPNGQKIMVILPPPPPKLRLMDMDDRSLCIKFDVEMIDLVMVNMDMAVQQDTDDN